MRNSGMIFCSVLLMAMVFFPGCTTQDTGYPDSTPAPQVVKGNPPVTTPAPSLVNVHLPLATPTPQVVYVTVTVSGPAQTIVTAPVPASPSVKTVCSGSEHPAADIRMTGNVYGLASDPEAGIDEIRFTIGLDPCSPGTGPDKDAGCLLYPRYLPGTAHLWYQDLYRFFYHKNRYFPGHFTESR